MAAHDLRNPLTVIKGYVDLFKSGMMGPIPDEHLSIFQAMNHSCNRMLDLLNEKGAGHIKIFGGGGGVILPEENRKDLLGGEALDKLKELVKQASS